MTDLTNTIEAKSDQLGADDLMSGPRNIKITKVSADTGSSEQPIVISFEGDNRKPWKPCKSMRRLLVAIWGANGNEYVGRSVTLYRDPTVKWGGMEVGGIRISHMSHIDKPVTIALTATRGNKRPTTVQPLVIRDEPKQDRPKQITTKEFAGHLRHLIDNGTAKEATDYWDANEEIRKSISAANLDKMGLALADKIEKDGQ